MTETHEPQGSPPPGDQPKANGNGNALTVIDQQSKPVAREIRVVADPVPILDTARFEHMQRIATVMAVGRLLPDSICKTKDNGQDVWLSEAAVQARCFMIVNQAVRWGMDPFAVAQTASFVNGRLMWEGKLIHAIIEARLGIRLKYTFVNDTSNRAADDRRLGVIVSGQFDDETEARTIEGTVARWHKGEKSAWGNPADWHRQLRYMGAREWARAHAPGIILGVVTVDEVDPENPGFTNGQQGPVPRRLTAPAPPTDTKAPAAIAHQPAEAIDAVEQAAADLKERAYAEAPAEPVQGKTTRKAAPPPPEDGPSDAELSSRARLIGLKAALAGCPTGAAVVSFQKANAPAIMSLLEDDREQLVEAIEAKKAELAL
jgi:hypothetical protein